jgi:two-component system sensor histidine kinase KdpD
MTDEAQRPSPDALLTQAETEGRGRLKIFLGAAPGVGKTFEMLTQARRRKLGAADAVIGVVETHGRIETDLLTKGFDTIPKRRVPYKGRVLAEMDLDAILQRKPKLVLVDELAHTNAPGSRHPKRYQDVEEILSPGSTSIPRSTSSTWRASMTSWRRSPTSRCARPCRIRSSTGPMTWSWSI